MRHRKTGRKLNRNASHRKAMFSNMMTSLLRYEEITTTLPKAKELRRFIEPLITKAKIDSVHNRRYVFAKLRDDEITAKLFTEVGPFYQDRPGGYTRVLKSGFRSGDKAPMAIVQLVDFESLVNSTKDNQDKKAKIGKAKTSKEKVADKTAETNQKASDNTKQAAEDNKAVVEKDTQGKE